MEKVGIMTFHGADNYGAVLQAYALHEWLKKNGYTPEFIDYRSRAYEKYDLFRSNRYKKRPVFAVEDLLNYTKNKARKNNFQAFRKEHLTISETVFTKEADLDAVSDKYDWYICGSDQIWNPTINRGLDTAFLLNFVKNNQKKIAYAPSLGVDHLGNRDLIAIEEAIRSFHAVSVREEQGVDILQPYCNKKINCVCDPVFLLDESDYTSICKPAEGGKYVFLYIVGSARQNRHIISYAQKLAENKKMHVIYIIDGNKTLFHIKGENAFGCKVEKFLSLIKNAELVISNSFHATAFSVILKKQFVTFSKQGTSSRMYNLLKEFKLLNRVFSNDLTIEEEIDFQYSNSIIEEMRKNAEAYLRAALGMAHNEKDMLTLSDEEGAKADLAYKDLQTRSHALDGKCFLATNKDALVRRSSRSGGVFTPISDLVLQKGGVVYGCKMEKVDKAVHFRATTAEERNQFRGSKYIQSEMGDCYRKVKEDLKEGLPVLFSGTPCQIAGLNAYLEKDDTHNLLTMDIVCHGVPSPIVWHKYLEWMSKQHNGVVEAVDFRDKRYGWKAHFESVKIHGRWYTTSVFRILFYKHLILRPACYRCPYANLNRQGDITIGDAWGIEKANPSWNDDKGASLVIINSEKGKQAFEAVQSLLCVQSVDIEDYMQPNLKGPSERNNDRDAFWHEFSEKGFEHILSKYAKQGRKKTIKDEIVLIGTKMHLNGLIKKLTK